MIQGDDGASPPWLQHLRPSLAGLTVYDLPPADAPVRLHANECPQPWPAEVSAALADVVREIEFSRYPDTSGRTLRAVLARTHGCAAERIVLGNGSDEVIAQLLTALAGSGQAAPVLVVPTPTFVMYAHTAEVLGYTVRSVPLDTELQLDRAAMRRALPGASVCFLARPNNPTGTLWDAAFIRTLIADHPSVVFVVDEAYGAYAPGESMWRDRLPDNQVLMTTLSKVGLAALRIGYCIAHPTLAEALNKVRHPYNISATSLALATAVLTRFTATQAAMVAATIAGRTALEAHLRAIPGAQVVPSHANFVLVRLQDAGDPPRLRAFLAGRGILVKDVSQTPGLARCLRVGVGTPEELERLGDALASWSPMLP